MRRLLSVLMAAFMLLTLPLTTGIARAVAEDTTEPADQENPSGSIALEMEEMDPAKLHVRKLGEEDEEEDDGFDPAELEITDINKVVRVSIFLDGKSTIDMGYDTQGIANNSSAAAYRNKLRKQQETMQAKIEEKIGHSLNVKWNLTLLTNAISVEIPYKDVLVIRGMDGVKSVELETQYEAPTPVDADPNTANTSENMVGATNAWYQLGFTGAGSRVAIIDTGLDTDHQSVNADAFDHAIAEVRAEGKTITLMEQISSSTLNQLNAKEKMSSLTAANTYKSTKIPYAFNYVDNGTRVDHKDSASNHGSHVAGIAAANRYIKQGTNYVDAAANVGAVGMAPDAQILVMKVFGTGGGAYDSDYFAAIEDAIVLEADAANLSLGSGAPGFTYSSTSYQEILNGLVGKENLHMVLSISAGNVGAFDQYTPHKVYAEDAYFHTGGSPGSFIHSLCVAAAQNTLTKGTPLEFNGSQQVFYAESTEDSEGNAYSNPAISTITGSYSYVYIDATGTAADYSTVNGAASLSGKIVIVNRGDLSFSEKGNNAKSYSPKAVIVANNDDGTIYMNLADFTGTFPMVSIALKDANAIKAASTSHTVGDITYYTGTVVVSTTEVSTVAARQDAEITDFSSWGVPGSLIMKPEITAPGGDIYSINGTSSASSDSDTGTDKYVSYSGTSMAAPHITGLSAVLMQYLREQEPANTDLMNGYNLRAIANSLLMSTATPMINQNAYLSILQQGAGLVEISKAIEAKSVIMMDEAYLTSDTNAAADGKVKVELGDDPEKLGEYDYKFTIYNISDKTLEFEFDTDLFTQAVSGETLSRKTAILPQGGVTYDWNGEAATVPAESHDVDRDGDTDADDAQAILDIIAGLYDDEEDLETRFDLEAAEMDDDGMLTSHDAKLLLDFEAGEETTLEGYFIAPGEKAQVTVHIRLTDAQREILDKEGGAYLEGFTYVDCVTVTDEDEDLSHEHTIPILGYFGSWTDPEMFDTNSYTENLYGNEQLNYSGSSAASTNYMRITTNGTLAKFSGNPYMVEDEFPEGRLAIRSDAKINNIAYNLIRSAGGTGFAITKLDADGNVTGIVTKSLTGQSVTGQWYSQSTGAWQNTTTKQYSVNKALNEFNGIAEGDRVRVGFYAIPEYNVMKVSGDMSDAGAGILTDSRFESILTSNVLGKGAFVGFDFVVDDTDPEIVGQPTLTGNTLSITASDDRAIAYIGVLSLDGTVKYAEVAPGTDTYTVELDAADAIANASGYVAAFVGDYAGNEAAYAVKVNNNTHVEKTVYVLTNTLEAGNDYLISEVNAAGTGHILSYSAGSYSNTVAATAVTVKAGDSGTNGQPYIESADVPSTGVWTASSGIRLMNGSNYLRHTSNTSNTINISTTNTYNTWTYNTSGTYADTLQVNSRYLRYYNNNFSLSTANNKIYIYVKTQISYEVDPYSVMSVTVTPGTLDLYRGGTASLTAKVMPLTASPRTVTWTSSNENVATVNDVGVVTAVAAGTATIRATSDADNTKYGECTVNVVAINKALRAIVWDPEANIFFSSFNPNNMPNWTKLHDNGQAQALINAEMGSTSVLYASTLDVSEDNTLYTVNRTSYALTEKGTLYVPTFGMAPVGTSFGSTSYFVYAFAKYLLFGNIEPADDGDGNMYSGLPYGLLDLTTTSVGDAYAVAVCARSISTTSATYYFLDEVGKIWQISQSYSSSAGITFGTPTLVYDTGVSAGLMYNSIYYDGTNIYWTHQDGDYSELYIYVVSSGKFYHAGNFGDNVWPVTGLYVDGSVAPSSVGDEDEIMSEELNGELQLQVLASRDELMTADIMARFAAEAEKYGLEFNMPEEPVEEEPIEEPVEEEPIEEPVEEEPIEEPVEEEPVEEEPIEEPVEEEPVEEPVEEEPVEEPEEAIEEPEEGASRAHIGIFGKITGVATDGVIPFAEDEASTNGLFAVAYDPDILTCTANAKGTAENLYVSIHVDAEKGVVTVAYAMKGETALTAGTPIATLTFEAESCGSEATVIEVDTLERGEDLELDEIEEIPFPSLDHIWGEPTYEWELVDGAWKCTATVVCTRNEEHVMTETVTATSEVKTAATCEEAGTTTYTATFTNEAFETQTKDVADIEATGHDWDAPTYEWAEDNSTVTATRVCKNDPSHVETETVNTTSEVKTAATCEEAGTTTYTATFTNEAFETQTKDVADIAAIGHAWGEVTYTWDKDGSNWICTATRVCGNDASHVETETVTAVRTEANDVATYTATFANEAFETQVKEFELGYYLVGSVTEWAVIADEAHKFVPNPDNEAEYMLAITLAEGAEFKAVRAEGDTIITWYPDQSPNYIVGANQAGDVTVYFRPDGQGGEGWHYGYLYIAVPESTVTITLDPCNGDEVTTITIPAGGTIEELPAGLQREWYKFIGWFMDSRTGLETGTGERVTTETVFNEDTTIYANWYMPGDVNGDGKVNNKDVNLLMNYVGGDDVTVVLYACDVTADGKINNKDVNLLMNYVAGEDVEIN